MLFVCFCFSFPSFIRQPLRCKLQEKMFSTAWTWPGFLNTRSKWKPTTNVVGGAICLIVAVFTIKWISLTTFVLCGYIIPGGSLRAPYREDLTGSSCEDYRE